MRIRIALLDVSPMLSEILEATLDPIEAVDLGGSPADADFIIARSGALREDEVVELLYERPRRKLLTVEEDGPQAYLFELRPERVELGELSPARLVDLVNAVAASA